MPSTVHRRLHEHGTGVLAHLLAECLRRLERLFAALDSRDVVVAVLPVVTDAAQHPQFRRGVDESREHEQQDDGWRDEEQLTIEAHSHN